MPVIELSRENLSAVEYTAKQKLLELHRKPNVVRNDGHLDSTQTRDFRAHAKLLREVLKARRKDDEAYISVYEMGVDDVRHGDVDKAFGEDVRPWGLYA